MTPRSRRSPARLCAKCGARGRKIDVRPNWKEQTERPGSRAPLGLRPRCSISDDKFTAPLRHPYATTGLTDGETYGERRTEEDWIGGAKPEI